MIKTPLIKAIENKKHDAILLLLQHGANPNFKTDSKFYPPLFIAIKLDDKYVVRLLLEYGADVEYNDYFEDELNLWLDDLSYIFKPLNFAAGLGSISMIEILLEYGAKIEKDGPSCALYISIKEKNDDVTKFLLEKGAKPNTKCLKFACKNGNPKIVSLLLKHEIINNCRDEEIFFNALKPGLVNSFKITKLLVESGMDVNARGYEGKTALHYMATDDRICKYLIKNGADPEIKDCYGKTYKNYTTLGMGIGLLFNLIKKL